MFGKDIGEFFEKRFKENAEKVDREAQETIFGGR